MKAIGRFHRLFCSLIALIVPGTLWDQPVGALDAAGVRAWTPDLFHMKKWTQAMKTHPQNSESQIAQRRD